MKQIPKILIGSALTALLVALIYIVFEESLNWAIDKVWIDLLNSQSNRLLTAVFTVATGFGYFASKHYLADQPKAKNSQNIIHKLLIVLFVGFLSLFAGAALGPEAILIPASLIVGQLISGRLNYGNETKRKTDNKGNLALSKLLSLAGFVALFVAFFNSLLGGVLGYYLANKGRKRSELLAINNLIVLGISSVVSLITLNQLSHRGSFVFPTSTASWSVVSISLLLACFVIGIFYQRMLSWFTKQIQRWQQHTEQSWSWKKKALASSAGLAILFLIGGYYIQFTGNHFIADVIKDAKVIGIAGLIWISVIKIIAIAWSNTTGYRGGQIFPMTFVASATVAALSLIFNDIHIVAGVFLILAGAIYGDKKDNILMGHLGV